MMSGPIKRFCPHCDKKFATEDARQRHVERKHAAQFMPLGRCPVLTCKSPRIIHHGAKSKVGLAIARAWGNRAYCPIDQCADCNAIWEPWPAGTSIDCVERGPCDNCAYRVGSRESSNPDEWANLKAIAQNAAEFGAVPEALGGKWFSCHKGIPIRLDKENGSIEFDYQSAGIDPFRQSCAGFLRMMWAFQKPKRTRNAEAAP